MPDFFPPDVLVRIAGNLQAAEKLFGAARSLLFRAIQYKAASGLDTTKLTYTVGELGYVRVLLAGPLKIVQIVPVLAPVGEIARLKEEEELLLPGGGPNMVHGVIDVGTIIEGDPGPPVVPDVLHQFWPTPVCSAVYQLPFDWQDMAKLAVRPLGTDTGTESQYADIKPGMFSGKMKYVVQAIFGLGRIDDKSPEYISGHSPDPTDRYVKMPYDYQLSMTHGIYKAGPKNHWLIEIGSTNGVLAMPLPILASTRKRSYYQRLRKRKDTDTMAVIDEFGGLPSGEPMPTGEALINALAEGKVLRLLYPSDLSAFYNKNSYAASWGWAFNNTGSEARNTCWLRDTSGDFSGFKRSYQYKIAISLSTHNTAVRPVGAGSAALSLVDSGVIFAPWLHDDDSFLLYINPSISSLFIPVLDGDNTRLGRFVLTDFPDQPLSNDEDWFGTQYGAWTIYPPVGSPPTPWPPNEENGGDYFAPGGPPDVPYPRHINSGAGYAPIFVFFRADDSVEVVRYGTENMAMNRNVLWSDSIDRRVYVGPGSTRRAVHTMFVGLPHCREGWAGYSCDLVDDGLGAADLYLDVYTAGNGLRSAVIPTGYSDPGTGFSDELITFFYIQEYISNSHYDFTLYYPWCAFDANENGGPTPGYVQHNTIHFGTTTVLTPSVDADHSNESYANVKPHDIDIDGIKTGDVNWVGNV